MKTNPTIPLDVLPFFPELDKKLISLLRSLTPEEWQTQTIAKLWKVKDVAAHLLDGNIRTLSMLRDNYYGERADVKSYQDLVNFLNGLNADWVKAMKRVSPDMLIILHEITGPLYVKYLESLDPFGKSPWAVDWAGESESKNWMHIAREYTEKWLHQQQIRDAVNRQELMTRDFFYPFIDVFMMGLPHTYREVKAETGSVIKLTITSDIGGSWFLVHTNSKWMIEKGIQEKPASEITIDPDTAWKLFSKSWRPEHVRNKITITGNEKLGEVALTMVSVIA